MTIKWNRESFLVILTALMILIGLFYYGNHYFVQPIQEEALISTDTVEHQQRLMDTYPPSEELLAEYEESYSAVENLLPSGVQVTDELVTLEEHAESAGVTIQTVSRSMEQQPLEGMAEDFIKDIYTAEITTNSPANFRQLIQHLMDENRVWNISAFSYEKVDEENYTGTFNFELYYVLDNQ